MNWVKTHKLLLVIYAVGITLGLMELDLSEEKAGLLERPEAYVPSKHNVADVSAEIYPGRALTLYYQAYQAALCSQPAHANSEGCKSRDPVRPGAVRELIKQSLATGNRSIEMALYNYAVVLIQEGAPAEEIDAAVRQWRSAHPLSKLPDPRAAMQASK